MFYERSEILARKAGQAGGVQGAEGRRAPPVAQSRDLGKVIAGPELPDHMLLATDALEHVNLVGADDIEASIHLTLAHDRLARAEPHPHHGVAAPDRQWVRFSGITALPSQ